MSSSFSEQLFPFNRYVPHLKRNIWRPFVRCQSLNVNSPSNMNSTPFIIDIVPFNMAKSLVRVRNECSHASMIITPDAINSVHPIRLKKMSRRLLMSARNINPANDAIKMTINPQNVPVAKKDVTKSPSLKL